MSSGESKNQATDRGSCRLAGMNDTTRCGIRQVGRAANFVVYGRAPSRGRRETGGGRRGGGGGGGGGGAVGGAGGAPRGGRRPRPGPPGARRAPAADLGIGLGHA